MKRINLIYKPEEPEAPKPLFRVWSEGFGYVKEAYVDTDGLVHEIWRGDSGERMMINPRTLNGYTIERATGMTDTNGAEIYEGDIIATTSPDNWVYGWDNKAIVGVVRYSPADSGFELRRLAIDGLPNPIMLIVCDDEDIEVLGNIHENAELLEVGE